jgi:AraC family transcriptional regulator, regulatory protein of adaptative response / DNA-3-methyladenine glycosylase II
MPLDDDASYQALRARDARFDGRLFVGVTSTKVYCRPICRVRTPRRENCRFFATPAQAEAQAFRPCLKCRPELAPGPGLAWTVMDASRTLARQAAQALDSLAASGDTPSLAHLAERMGVSDRHLRRIFATEHGVTPMQYVQTRRLLLAKQLLTETQLPVAQIALASGFRSLRRFNAAFADNYRMSPSRLRDVRAGVHRNRVGDDGDGEGIAVTLSYRQPLDQAALLHFIAQRAIPGVEVVDGKRIRRSLRIGSGTGATGWLETEFLIDAPQLRLRFPATLALHSATLIGAVRRWLDLDAAPQAIDASLAMLPGAAGLRLPGGLDGFELAVRAVLGQQVSVAAARTLAARLVGRFGVPVATPWVDVDRLFPVPAVLASAAVDDMVALGILRSRAAAIVALAQDWPAVAALLRNGTAPDALIARLCALPGIGPWTAHYVAMRALGWPDTFLPNDVALLKAMKNLFHTHTQREADAKAEAWRPWRSYAVLRLWNSLENAA